MVSLALLRLERLEANRPDGDGPASVEATPIAAGYLAFQHGGAVTVRHGRKNYISLLHGGTAPYGLMSICSDSSHIC